MSEIEVITYEQARTDFLKLEMEKAQNRMKFWQTKIKKAKNAIAEMEARENASNAGWEYNFYKDALEALENNRFQYETGFIKGFEAAHPKWISVEDDIPTDDCDVLAWVGNKEIAIAWFDGYTGEWHAYGSYEGDVTHWMHLPCAPKEEA